MPKRNREDLRTKEGITEEINNIVKKYTFISIDSKYNNSREVTGWNVNGNTLDRDSMLSGGSLHDIFPTMDLKCRSVVINNKQYGVKELVDYIWNYWEC